MYNYQRRMLQKREDAYRAEFPGNYYSSSSVYSYSPTSTSDCPEHGRSRKRRTTTILVTSIVLATLGVLTIAGIAAYLGIISKNISNNASQYEESYLQANTTIDRSDSSEEDIPHHQHGRSKDDSGFIDLTNSLSDDKTAFGPPGDDDHDLINFRRKGPGIIDDSAIKYKKPAMETTAYVNGTGVNPSPVNITGKPVPVVVKSTSSSSSSSVSSQGNPIYTYYNPIGIFPPPTRVPEENNQVTFFTEEPTSTSTKPPNRPNSRNRSKYSTTTESLSPSTKKPSASTSTSTTERTTTTTITKKVQNKEIVTTTENGETVTTNIYKEPQRENENPSTTVPVPVDEHRFRSTMKKPTNSQSITGNVRESIVHVTPADAKIVPNQQISQAFSKRFGSPNVKNEDDNRKKMNDSDPQDDVNNGDDNANLSHIHKGEDASSVQTTSSQVDPAPTQVHFTPITPLINDEVLLNNHKMPISFDRVNPEFYDKNPWMPLLDRPNMDKRPRVDATQASQVSTGESIEKNVDNNGGSPFRPSIPQYYYDYGHTGPQSTVDRLHNENAKQTSEFVDNEAISHGAEEVNISTTSGSRLPSHDHSEEEILDKVNGSSQIEPHAYVEETTGGFRPVAIPAYTVIIPHIPNLQTNVTKINVSATEDREQAEGEEDMDLDKFHRVGLLEVAESGERSPPTDINGDDDSSEKSAKNEAEEDYGDNEELTDDNHPSSPAKIYKLDPDSVDIVPDTLGSVNNRGSDLHIPESQDLKKSEADVESQIHDLHSHSSVEETTPREPDPSIKSTTDLIMSTLGSLNLIKITPTTEGSDSMMDAMLRASDLSSEEEEMESLEKEQQEVPSGDDPLFPPVRSYVSVNLPLRPKPSPAPPLELNSSSHKQLRIMEPIMRPDLTTVSTLQQVLSMMMKFDDGKEEGRDLKGDIPVVNVTKQNVNLLVAGTNGSHTSVSKNLEMKHVTTPSTPILTMTSTRREQKSFNRRSKIDEQFAAPGNVEHLPVPLVESVSTSTTRRPLYRLTNVTVNDKNSPVYKFVLRQGQSIEDLLKEIFQNYTEATQLPHEQEPLMSDDPNTANRSSHSSHSHIPVHLHSPPIGPSLKSLDDGSKGGDSTKNGLGVTFTNVKIKHLMEQIQETPQEETTTTPSTITTTEALILQTVTSIVINESETVDECPRNNSFRCVSTGQCIPSYLRCNYIKECPDNSDEEGCSCADFLRANGNGRKLCDGVVDCADASDEYTYCDYCNPGQYICMGSRSCINKTQICDSRRDCPNGDDENDCVRIGQSTQTSDLEEFSSVYSKNGQLMVRKKGVWGKLCVETFNSVVSHWEVKDLAKAVCKALTFSDYETVERIRDGSNSTDPFYELFYGVSNETEGDASEEQFSSESTPRVGLGFKKTECKSRSVVNVTCQDLQCGTAPKSFTQTARIVGGANSMPGKWPWQAALYKNGEYQCGATLISNRWLLSAGHCFYNAQDDYWVARLGTLRRGATVLSPYEQVIRITHIFLHPQYQNVGFVNDVSLLRLEKEVNFTDYVRPVCLPSKDTVIRDGRMCTVVGWGQLFEVGRVFPDTLQEVQLPLISTAECRKRTLFLPLYKLTNEMFCAGYDRGGRDACLGDSGGPMMCQEPDGRWSLYGVTSNGYGCARANRPGVYTKVASYLDWIHEKMKLEDSVVFREKPKICPGHRCLLGECLDRRHICDGIMHCVENGSDERGPNCTTHFRIT